MSLPCPLWVCLTPSTLWSALPQVLWPQGHHADPFISLANNVVTGGGGDSLFLVPKTTRWGQPLLSYVSHNTWLLSGLICMGVTAGPPGHQATGQCFALTYHWLVLQNAESHIPARRACALYARHTHTHTMHLPNTGCSSYFSVTVIKTPWPR